MRSLTIHSCPRPQTQTCRCVFVCVFLPMCMRVPIHSVFAIVSLLAPIWIHICIYTFICFPWCMFPQNESFCFISLSPLSFNFIVYFLPFCSLSLLTPIPALFLAPITLERNRRSYYCCSEVIFYNIILLTFAWNNVIRANTAIFHEEKNENI